MKRTATLAIVAVLVLGMIPGSAAAAIPDRQVVTAQEERVDRPPKWVVELAGENGKVDMEELERAITAYNNGGAVAGHNVTVYDVAELRQLWATGRDVSAFEKHGYLREFAGPDLEVSTDELQRAIVRWRYGVTLEGYEGYSVEELQELIELWQEDKSIAWFDA